MRNERQFKQLWAQLSAGIRLMGWERLNQKPKTVAWRWPRLPKRKGRP